jgi:NAD(P)-dependent dehydrogenase (short-subunit alcohol dehydrogenase family)
MMRVYGASKLANILFARELARRWYDRGVTVNALHPGFVATSLGGDGEAGWFRHLFSFASSFLARSPEAGARTSVHLASSPDVAGTTGSYFVNEKVHRTAPCAQDDAAALLLWNRSVELVGLDDGHDAS